jgi:AcrR family transcriptional regulator
VTATAAPPPTRTRNPRGEGRRLRADILAAAAGLLDAGGDERALTLRAVARRTGIATPSIYPHFDDRAALLLAVVRAAFVELQDRMRVALDGVDGGPRRRLDAACLGYLDFARDHPQRYRTMFGGSWAAIAVERGHDPAALGGQVLQVLADCLGECRADRTSEGRSPTADALALWLGLHGLAHQRAVTATYPWPGDIVARITHPLAHLDAV